MSWQAEDPKTPDVEPQIGRVNTWQDEVLHELKILNDSSLQIKECLLSMQESLVELAQIKKGEPATTTPKAHPKAKKAVAALRALGKIKRGKR